jgi:6-pyruvoyltetrahydropterin/6-carboxytetrahydropterin synthase
MLHVRVYGEVIEDMVVEFGELKKTVKKVVDEMDHKLIVAGRYVERLDDSRVKVSFRGVGGEYTLILPTNSIYVIEKDSTVENISEHIANRLKAVMPRNVLKVSVRMSEGFGKSATSKA